MERQAAGHADDAGTVGQFQDFADGGEFILAARSASFQVVIKQVSISTSPVPTGLANVRSHAVVGHVLAKVHCFLRNSGGADSTATALQQVGLLCRASFAGVGVAGSTTNWPWPCVEAAQQEDEINIRLRPLQNLYRQSYNFGFCIGVCINTVLTPQKPWPFPSPVKRH
ncbi:hypothetical protein J4711_14960 [Staphylococcus epidermidis]|nr:hypothetical protein [Staphylococcus epidermidis]